MMGKLDSPLDAAFEANSDPEENPIAEAIAVFTASLFPITSALVALAEHLSTRSRLNRLRELTFALRTSFQTLEQQVAGNSSQLREIGQRLESEEFKRAMIEAAEEAIRGADEAKMPLFVAVLSGYIDPSFEWDLSDDPAALIRDVAQLSAVDLRVLQLLRDIFVDTLTQAPNLDSPNPFTSKTKEMLKCARDANFHPDDFYSHCKRLEGFGLAIEATRNPSHQGPGEYCFRPTRRGKRLIEVLQRAGEGN